MDRFIGHPLKPEVLGGACLDVVLQNQHALKSSEVPEDGNDVSIGVLSTMPLYIHACARSRVDRGTSGVGYEVVCRHIQTRTHTAGR